MTEEIKPFAGYDELAITEAQVEFMKETGEYENLTDDELYGIASQDSFIFADAWDDMLDTLDEQFFNVQQVPVYEIEGSNIGWQNLHGRGIREIQDARDFFRQVMPKTQITIRIYKEEERINIWCAHHDSPTGETYTVTPRTPIDLITGVKDKFRLLLAEEPGEEPDIDQLISDISEHDLLDIGRELETWYFDEPAIIKRWVEEEK